MGEPLTRVSTKSFVDWIRGNSKSNHVGAQETFNRYRLKQRAVVANYASLEDDDDKFTPTKHLTPPPHHSSRPAAAHTDTETPLLHQKKGRAHRRTAPTDLAHNRAPQARPRRRAWARGTVQRHVDAGFSPSTRR